MALLGEEDTRLLGEALATLGIRNLVFGIHDASFPGLPDEDLGRGTPYSHGAWGLIDFVRSLGFTGVQLGPQGDLSETNPSPYDGTLFSRNVMNAQLVELTEGKWSRLLEPERVAELLRERPEDSQLRAAHRHVHRAVHRALPEACLKLLRGTGAPDEARREVVAEFSAFTGAHATWLEADAMYQALCQDTGKGYWREWPDPLDQRLFAARTLEEETRAAARRREIAMRHTLFVEYAFSQFVVHVQHRNFRTRLNDAGLKLFGDLQVGRAPQDVWSQQAMFLDGYKMGAPPSRTNPEGQDWNYDVPDPALFRGPDGRPGPALRGLTDRIRKMFSEYDGVRIDHPHGLVCPWVYRDQGEDRLASVRAGARLFSSPDLPDHPDLATHAIARPDQLDRSQPRYADGWVQQLDEEQVSRYAQQFEVIAAACKESGRDVRDLVCEVLSTQPYPLRRVMDRYGLGRFRVTQKVDLHNPADGYRSENAQPADWIMVGNHDTRPLWRVVDDWDTAGQLPAHAAYLAERLCPNAERREDFARQLARSPRVLAQAKAAELFASPAQNALVFFTDLLGMRDLYNAPGTVNATNWSLRVPPTYAQDYQQALTEDAALNVPWALAWALRAKGHQGDLVEKVEALAVRLRGGQPLPAHQIMS